MSDSEPRPPSAVAQALLWVGAISVVLGVVGQMNGLFQSAAPAHNPELDTAKAQMLADAEKAKREAAEAARAKAEDAALVSAFRARIAQHDAAVDQVKRIYAPGGKEQFHRLDFKNACKAPIVVAVRYRAMNNVWVTRGWWTVDAGQRVPTPVVTRNRIIYIFAKGGGLEWNGKGKEDSRTRAVVSSVFIDDGTQDLAGRNLMNVSFFAQRLDEAWGTFLQTFTCT